MRHVPPPLWALALLGAGYALSLAPGFNALAPMPTRPLGAIVLLAALAVLLTAMAQFLLARTQLLPTSETNNALVTSGVFALTRNPMYLALSIVHIGLAALLDAPIALFALLAILPVMHWGVVLREEAYLEAKFGDDYRRYMQATRRYF